MSSGVLAVVSQMICVAGKWWRRDWTAAITGGEDIQVGK